eukprot:jgi/Psemu1/49408/gm1.49408_g
MKKQSDSRSSINSTTANDRYNLSIQGPHYKFSGSHFPPPQTIDNNYSNDSCLTPFRLHNNANCVHKAKQLKDNRFQEDDTTTDILTLDPTADHQLTRLRPTIDSSLIRSHDKDVALDTPIATHSFKTHKLPGSILFRVVIHPCSNNNINDDPNKQIFSLLHHVAYTSIFVASPHRLHAVSQRKRILLTIADTLVPFWPSISQY